MDEYWRTGILGDGFPGGVHPSLEHNLQHRTVGLGTMEPDPPPNVHTRNFS